MGIKVKASGSWQDVYTGENFNTFTELTSLDNDDELVIYDDSESVYKKVGIDTLRMLTPPTMIVEHQESAGTNGGTNTTGSWQTRKANVAVLNEIAGASLSSNQITLPAGTYEFWGWQAFVETNNTSVRLYDTTAGSLVGSGSSGYAPNHSSVNNHRPMQGRFTLTSTSVLEMQYRTETVQGIRGLGDASYADPEVYAHLTIKKIG